MKKRTKILISVIVLIIIIGVILITTGKGCNLGNEKAKTEKIKDFVYL